MGIRFSSTTAAPYEYAPQVSALKIFGRIALDCPLASQHRACLQQAIQFVDADKLMREALLLYEERLYDIDKQVSCDIVILIAMFYVTYARLLTTNSDENTETKRAERSASLRSLLDARRQIFDKLSELELKVVTIHLESAYHFVISSIQGALTSCMVALWHKHGFLEAIEMYRPMPSSIALEYIH